MAVEWDIASRCHAYAWPRMCPQGRIHDTQSGRFDRIASSDLFGLDWTGLDWTGLEDRSSPVLWKPDLDPGAPWSSGLPAKPNMVTLGNIMVLRIKSRGSRPYQIIYKIVYITPQLILESPPSILSPSRSLSSTLLSYVIASSSSSLAKASSSAAASSS